MLADLDIRRIGLSVVVVEGTDEHALRLAAGHLVGSGLPGESGNVVIAAHCDTFFASLRNVRVGDTIDLTSPEGTYHFRVDWTRIVEAIDSQALDPTPRPVLTLITCYPFSYLGSAPDCFVVRTSMSEGQHDLQPGPKGEQADGSHVKNHRRGNRTWKSAL